MTKTEVKQERKQSFGDPRLVKERKKELKAASERIVGVANSTFLARGSKGIVGVCYIHNETPAPILTVRAGPSDTANVVTQARRHNIPIVKGAELVEVLQSGVGVGDGLTNTAAVTPFIEAFGRYSQGEHLI